MKILEILAMSLIIPCAVHAQESHEGLSWVEKYKNIKVDEKRNVIFNDKIMDNIRKCRGNTAKITKLLGNPTKIGIKKGIYGNEIVNIFYKTNKNEYIVIYTANYNQLMMVRLEKNNHILIIWK